MKKADGNLYFRRLFVYILIPFFAGPFSGGLPTPCLLYTFLWKMTSINGKRRRIGDDVVYFFIYLCAALSVVLLAGIIIYVFVRGIRCV